MQIIRAEYFPFKEQTEELIKIGLEVHKTLGYGFKEVVYQDACEYELIQRKIPYIREKAFSVKYKDKFLQRVFKPDFYVYDHLVLELKARSEMLSEDFVQVLNFLKCADTDLALVLNFGKKKLDIKKNTIQRNTRSINTTYLHSNSIVSSTLSSVFSVPSVAVLCYSYQLPFPNILRRLWVPCPPSPAPTRTRPILYQQPVSLPI